MKGKRLCRLYIYTGHATSYYNYHCSLGTETIERVFRTCCDMVAMECLGGVASNSYEAQMGRARVSAHLIVYERKITCA